MYLVTKNDPLESHTIELSDAEFDVLIQGMDDAAYYRLGDEAANESEIEDEDDKDLYADYRRLEEKLSTLKEEKL